VGRPEIAASEKLDVDAITRAIVESGRRAESPDAVPAIVDRLVELAEPGDTIAIMSNGAFGGIYDAVLAALTRRRLARTDAEVEGAANA
jgi:UDP-N-acetylmuramate: L-alanyl-gamma-D-glutamyl-meso-diaminopimelate ligase